MHKNAQKLESKTHNREEFPLTTLGCSVVRIFCVDDAFLEILELKASPEEGQQLQQKDEKRRKRNGEKKIKN